MERLKPVALSWIMDRRDGATPCCHAAGCPERDIQESEGQQWQCIHARYNHGEAGKLHAQMLRWQVGKQCSHIQVPPYAWASDARCSRKACSASCYCHSALPGNGVTIQMHAFKHMICGRLASWRACYSSMAAPATASAPRFIYLFITPLFTPGPASQRTRPAMPPRTPVVCQAAVIHAAVI